MYGYVYLIENLVNGKKYIGKKVSSKFKTSYYGSGTYIKLAVKKYGKDNFTIKVLEECEDKLKLEEREKYWIAQDNAVKSKEYYNISPGGGNGGYIHTEETNNKISEAMKNNKNTANHKWTTEQKNNLKNSIALSRGDDKNNSRGRKYINNGTDCLKIFPEDFYKYEQLGYEWGRLTSSEARDNMRKSRKYYNKVKLKCIELDIIFNGPNEVKDYFNKFGHIYDIISGTRTRTLGYTWEVIKDE